MFKWGGGGPGKLGRFGFQVTLSGFLAVVVIIAGWIYATHPTWQSTMSFLGVGFAMVAAVLGTYYIGSGLRITIDQRSEGLRTEKIARAFVYVDAWDHPSLSKTKQVVRDLVEAVRTSKTAPQKIREEIEADKEKESSVWDILNFLEGFSLAANQQLADDETLRRCFKDIVLADYLTLEPFIKEKRAEKNRPRLYTELEALAKRWNT